MGGGIRVHGAILLATIVGLLGASSPALAAGNSDAAALQVALRAAGSYDGTIDGVAGPATRAAISRFQSRNGLAADGVAGAGTRTALGRRGRPNFGSRTMSRGDSGWDVAALQFRLAWRGFPSGNLDGGFGSHTEAAVSRFQSWAGLPADGVAGQMTLRSLETAIRRSPIWLIHPLRASISDRFGPRGNRFHTGIDYPAAAGTTVTAAGRGRVVVSGWDPGGYGNLVVIEHPLGVRSMYAHLSSTSVSVGQPVVAGSQIGRVGATGIATGPHLHFEVRLGTAAIDPLTALR